MIRLQQDLGGFEFDQEFTFQVSIGGGGGSP